MRDGTTVSLIDLGLATACETCESEIEFSADSAEGLCRKCGLSFLLDETIIRTGEQAGARGGLGGVA